MNALLETHGGWAAFVLRIALGVVFFAHGAQLALGWFGGHGFKNTVQQFKQMGMPPPIGALVILAQFLGSLGLIVGLVTRIAAFGVLVVMLGAIFLVHSKVGFFMNWYGQQQGEGFEYHLLVAAIAIALMIMGAGNLSLDAAIAASSP
jgi:putative oxidoreductase